MTHRFSIVFEIKQAMSINQPPPLLWWPYLNYLCSLYTLRMYQQNYQREFCYLVTIRERILVMPLSQRDSNHFKNYRRLFLVHAPQSSAYDRERSDCIMSLPFILKVMMTHILRSHCIFVFFNFMVFVPFFPHAGRRHRPVKVVVTSLFHSFSSSHYICCSPIVVLSGLKSIILAPLPSNYV